MNANPARPALAISFAVTSLAGVAFLVTFWSSRDISTAWLRSGIFVGLMGVIHFVGYRLFTHQGASSALGRNIDLSVLRPHFPMIALTQLPCLIVSALLLDGGRGLRICFAAILAHWLSIAFVLAHDSSSMTKSDSMILRWGFFAWLSVAAIFGSLIS